MFEERLININQKIFAEESRLGRTIRVTKRAQQAFSSLDPDRENPIGGNSPIVNPIYVLDYERPYEEVMRTLRLRDLVRTNLKAAIPRMMISADQSKAELGNLNESRDQTLDEINSQLHQDHSFILDAVRKGNVAKSAISFVRGQFERFGLPKPEPERIPTPALDDFMEKNKKTDSSFRSFLESPAFGALIDAFESALQDDPNALDDVQHHELAGYIFENMAMNQARQLIAPHCEGPFAIVSPADTFELFRRQYPKKKVDNFFFGLQKAILGVSVPDAVIVRSWATGVARIGGIIEATSITRSGENIPEKKIKQMDSYLERNGHLTEDLEKIVEEQNVSSDIFDKYPQIRSRRLTLASQDEDFEVCCLVPGNATPPKDKEGQRTLQTSINSTALGLFSRALLSDLVTELKNGGDVSLNSFHHLARPGK